MDALCGGQSKIEVFVLKLGWRNHKHVDAAGGLSVVGYVPGSTCLCCGQINGAPQINALFLLRPPKHVIIYN